MVPALRATMKKPLLAMSGQRAAIAVANAGHLRDLGKEACRRLLPSAMRVRMSSLAPTLIR